MAVQVKKPGEIVAGHGLKMLCCGPSGAGKTVLGCTGEMPTLIVSAEAGLLSVQDAPDYIDATEVKSIADVEEVYQFLQAGTDYKLVVIDSLTEIAEVVLAHAKQQTKDPRQAYGSLIDEMGGLIRAFRDLPGYHVLMTAKQERIKDEHTGALIYMPSMPGSKLGQQLPYWFDEVFAYIVDKDQEGNIVRGLLTQRDGQFEAKDRSGKLAPFEEPNLATIIEKIVGPIPEMKKAS